MIYAVGSNIPFVKHFAVKNTCNSIEQLRKIY